MTKAKLIAAATLILFATISTVFSAETPRVANLTSRVADSGHANSAAENAKTMKGMRSLCLAMDLRYAKLETILLSSGNGSAEHFTRELANLESHLIGTPEGELIDSVLNKKDLTYFELLAAFDTVERKLTSKLTGEEGWAFRTGLKLMDILFAAAPGMETELLGHLSDLEALGEEGQAYAAEDELALLAAVTEADVTNGGQAAFDRIVIQSSAFTEAYLGIA